MENGLGGPPARGRAGHLSAHSCLCSARAEVAPRSKRRCVLERKQPYSGDEWCSGPDSEEDDKPIGAAHSEYPSMRCLPVPSTDGCPKGASLPRALGGCG